MKKLYILVIALVGCLGLQAKDMTGLRIYINPGHGGWDSDDRNVAVSPFAQGDTLGFWESSSNLHKGLMLRELLEGQGATVAMSRVRSFTLSNERLYSTTTDRAMANTITVYFIVFTVEARLRISSSCSSIVEAASTSSVFISLSRTASGEEVCIHTLAV